MKLTYVGNPLKLTNKELTSFINRGDLTQENKKILIKELLTRYDLEKGEEIGG